MKGGLNRKLEHPSNEAYRAQHVKHKSHIPLVRGTLRQHLQQ